MHCMYCRGLRSMSHCDTSLSVVVRFRNIHNYTIYIYTQCESTVHIVCTGDARRLAPENVDTCVSCISLSDNNSATFRGRPVAPKCSQVAIPTVPRNLCRLHLVEHSLTWWHTMLG